MPYPGHAPIRAPDPNQLTSDQMLGLARDAGWTGQNIDIAVAVAKAESGWIVNRVPPKPNSDGTLDYGLWQINTVHTPPQGPYEIARLLSDPVYNAQAAYNISGKGTHWSAWTTYNKGTYKQFLGVQGEQGQVTPFTGTDLATLAGGAFSSGLMGGNVLFRGPASDAPSQSAFDSRSNYPSGPFASAGTKGQIIGQTDPAVGYAVKFLYNPSSITFDYSVDTNIKDPAQQDPSQMQVGLPQGTMTSISFQLYFDRTFECRDGSQVGVLSDVHALEWVCGISDKFPYMLPNRVKLMFGAPQQLIWNAYITGLTVEYTHFNSAMIPIRCIVLVKALRMGADVFKGKDDPDLLADKKPKVEHVPNVTLELPGIPGVDVDPIALSGGA